MNLTYIQKENTNETILIDEAIDLDSLLDEEEVKDCLTSGDGLIYSLNNKGRVDIEYISRITGIDKETVIKDLKGSIYLDPEIYDPTDKYSCYKTSDEYLSGNLLKKLEIAEAKNGETKGLFKDNIEALKAIMPKKVGYDEIYYSLSSSWISNEIKWNFMGNLFNYSDPKGFVEYHEYLDTWKVHNYYYYRYDVQYGTPRITAGAIVEKLLNNKTIAVYDTVTIDGKDKRILNKEETLIAQQKAKLIQEEFYKYIKDFNLKDEIINAYNERYGFVVGRKYDGSFLTFPNMNKDIHLFDYQKNAIARIIFNHNTLLAHNVGAGKTYIMVAAGEELLRLGLSTKNLYIVPNNIVGQWERFYKSMYKDAKLLVTDTKDFRPNKIVDTLEKIKSDDYNAVIMPFSSFDRLDYSKTYKMDMLKQKIDELLAQIKSDYTYRLVSLRDGLAKELETLEQSIPTIPDDLGLENLGFTRIFLDEAHNYKNVALETVRNNIRGLNTNGSKKCNHMNDVCKLMNSMENGGIIMATGTPITNSISDVYVFQQYLQNGELTLLDIKNFDNWLSMFVEENDEIEVDVDTTNFRVVTRLSKFHNLPELTHLLSNVTDFYFDLDDKELPKFNGYTDVLTEKSDELNEFLKQISNRVEAIRYGHVKSKDDNMLKVTTDGRLAALDLRLIKDYKNPYYLYGKVYKCAKIVNDIYEKTNYFKGTQLVFSDIGTPKDSFNIYDALKKELVSYGIPDSEIAYIHDADSDSKRNKLFKDMNLGNIRILIGSTFKLGIGVNVQDKLYAIHHLDVPWRPSDMIQREGRILRKGNTNSEVFIYRYITEGSFDSYSWQILETKQKFINEILSNSMSDRTKEDVEDTVLSYGEVKALAIGDLKLKEYADLNNRLSKVRLLDRRQKERFIDFKRQLLEIPNKIESIDKYISNLKLDIECFCMNDYEISKDDRNNLKDLISNSLTNNLEIEDEIFITNYRGFELYTPYNNDINNLYLTIKNNGKYTIKIGNIENRILIRIDNFLESLTKQLKEKMEEKTKLEDLLISIDEELHKEVDYSLEMDELTSKIKKLGKELDI